MIKKVIQVALASLLVFFIAAPVIVGVYDAYTGGLTKGISGGYATGGIYCSRGSDNGSDNQNYVDGLRCYVSESDENWQNVYEGSSYNEGSFSITLPDGITAQSSGDCTRQVQAVDGESIIPDGQLQAENLLNAWYSGDPSCADLFTSYGAHLTYTFADGSTVDFGNPYILDWSDVPPPDDYDQVIYEFEKSQTSFLAPEKAYAGVVSFALGKLKYLCAQALLPAKSMLLSLMFTGATAMGMTATEASALMARFETALVPITEVLAKESPLLCEEGLAICAVDTVATTISRGVPISQMPAIAQESAIAMETTGVTLSGSSANFMTGIYQMLTTNQVSAQFLMSNADFFTTFFSWLGADLTSFDDVPTIGGSETSQIGSFTYGDLSIPIYSDFPYSSGFYADYSSFNKNGLTFTQPTFYYHRNKNSPSKSQDIVVLSADGATQRLFFYTDESGNITSFGFNNGYSNFLTNFSSSDSHGKYSYSGGGGLVTNESLIDSQKISLNTTGITIDEYGLMLNNNFNLYIDNVLVASFIDGSWTFSEGANCIVDGESGPIVNIGDIIGQDAEFDADGNLINAGNVSVPDITSPGYIQPGSFSEALDQMQSTATIEKPAQSTSPTIGGTGTVGDWINQNKPTTPDPSEESSQDDFMIEDLEKVFPFCIPWDLYYLLAIFTANPVAPNFNWHFNFAMAGEYDFYVDLSPFDAVAQVCRACETVLFCVGLALVTRNLIRG